MRWIAFLIVAVFTTFVNAKPKDNQRGRFVKDIAPILRKHCLQCHGSESQEGKLRLDSVTAAFKGGKSGKAIVPGNSKPSLLVRLIEGKGPKNLRMPPKEDAAALSRREIELVRAWIDAGAFWPKRAIKAIDSRPHWSLQPIRRSRLPAVKNQLWVRNAIDRFILARLESRGLSPSPRVSPRKLIRRSYLDVLGVPPDRVAADRFAANSSDLAYDQLVDRLLAHPRYGERWARHWLDLARYADTNGYEIDGIKPLAWKYRDWIIRALNSDKPYDQFVREQLAGDELENATADTVLATGFYRVGPWDAERGASVQRSEVIEELYNQFDDLVSTTAQVYLAMTVGCARCHNHKFDPITAKDYYSLVAVFRGLTRPHKGRAETTRPAVPAKSAKSKDAGKRFPQGYFFVETSAKPPVTHLLKRGSWKQPGEKVGPAVPVAMTKSQPTFSKNAKFTSRRRITLANWIVDRNNPLSSRVIVNRVWQYHFGVGIVGTPSDFGRRGDKPTHPLLLDWLAHWFMHDANWSIKRLHRLIMTSATYRMSKEIRPNAQRKDPDNRLFWRFPYRRLEVEAIRDSMLAVSGQLDSQMYGAGVYLHIPADARRSGYDPNKVWPKYDEKKGTRRTVYAFVKRTLVVPFLDTLDFCDTNRSFDRRDITTVAPQALELLNGYFANQQAKHFAERLIRETGTDPAGQIDRAYRLALARPPSPGELKALTHFLRRETERIGGKDANRKALVRLCRIVFNLNEFVFTD